MTPELEMLLCTIFGFLLGWALGRSDCRKARTERPKCSRQSGRESRVEAGEVGLKGNDR